MPRLNEELERLCASDAEAREQGRQEERSRIVALLRDATALPCACESVAQDFPDHPVYGDGQYSYSPGVDEVSCFPECRPCDVRIKARRMLATIEAGAWKETDDER